MAVRKAIFLKIVKNFILDRISHIFIITCFILGQSCKTWFWKCFSCWSLISTYFFRKWLPSLHLLVQKQHGNTTTMCKICWILINSQSAITCSKLTIETLEQAVKTPERRHWRCSEHISLNIFHTLFLLLTLSR